MTTNQRSKDPRLTSTVRSVLAATYRGWVSMVTGSGVVLMRPPACREPIDISQLFGRLLGYGWVFVEGFDLDDPNRPVEVPCALTRRGEDALTEAEADQR